MSLIFFFLLTQGAERKTRDEERRAAKRKMAASGRNKRLEELYHSNCERSEFYHMADLIKHPTLFTPDDHDKVSFPAVCTPFSFNRYHYYCGLLSIRPS